MFGSLFGKGKKKKSSGAPPDETLRSAQVGDVVVISGFSQTFADAYFIIEKHNRYEAETGGWHELLGVDGDRHVGIEWSESRDGLFISVTEQDSPMGLSSIGIASDELIRLDEEHSIDNFVTYEGESYFYSNSHEIYYFNDDRGEGEGFYGWDFVSENRNKMISVIKWEGMPFEVYVSEVVSSDLVSVYKK